MKLNTFIISYAHPPHYPPILSRSTSNVTPVLKLETGRSVSYTTFLSSTGGGGSGGEDACDEDCLAVAFSFSCQIRIYRLSVCLSRGSTSPDSYLSLEAQGRGRDGGHRCLLAYSPLAHTASHTSHISHTTGHTHTPMPSGTGMGMMMNLNSNSRHINQNPTASRNKGGAAGPLPVRLVAGGDLGWLRCWTVSRTGQLAP
ncbi:hypothetical protein EON65_45980, partial [archaeon]